MAFQFKVSKRGKDALNETSPNSFIFHTAYNTFKIVRTDILRGKSVSADPTVFSIEHGQRTIPAVYAFARFADGYVAMPDEKERADTHPVERYWQIEIDASSVYFRFYKGASATYTVDIRYYVFETTI